MNLVTTEEEYIAFLNCLNLNSRDTIIPTRTTFRFWLNSVRHETVIIPEKYHMKFYELLINQITPMIESESYTKEKLDIHLKNITRQIRSLQGKYWSQVFAHQRGKLVTQVLDIPKYEIPIENEMDIKSIITIHDVSSGQNIPIEIVLHELFSYSPVYGEFRPIKTELEKECKWILKKKKKIDNRKKVKKSKMPGIPLSLT